MSESDQSDFQFWVALRRWHSDSWEYTDVPETAWKQPAECDGHLVFDRAACVQVSHLQTGTSEIIWR